MLDGTKVMKRFKKWKDSDYNTYNLPKHVQASKSPLSKKQDGLIRSVQGTNFS
ncbi:hypothetical protein L916_08746 [Phytophthora nicotianae]|uniref:RxLR effector protein n=1 Tax=Phytophthora nicotianae TaxID=4792 RepID=W2J0S7_PHYNI|nr:hypothetical protein L916_08746 [Phytophthora nicotianae]